MAILTILRLSNQSLRKKAAKVDRITETELKILSDMTETMYVNSGVGLAATQVGVDKQLAVIDIGKGLVKMINPCLVKKEGTEAQDEGCLSVPNTTVKVKRAKKVIVDFLNESGEVCRISADGLFARAIQHELDHLAGRLIVDYMSPIKKIFRKN